MQKSSSLSQTEGLTCLTLRCQNDWTRKKARCAGKRMRLGVSQCCCSCDPWLLFCFMILNIHSLHLHFVNGTNKPTLLPLQSLSCLSSVTLVLTIKLVSIHLTAKVLTRPRPIGHVSILSSFYFQCQPFGFWLYIPTHTKRSKASFFDWALFCQKELFFSWISLYWGEFLHIGEQWTDLFLCARLLTDFCLWVFFCMLIISSCNAL